MLRVIVPVSFTLPAAVPHAANVNGVFHVITVGTAPSIRGFVHAGNRTEQTSRAINRRIEPTRESVTARFAIARTGGSDAIRFHVAPFHVKPSGVFVLFHTYIIYRRIHVVKGKSGFLSCIFPAHVGAPASPTGACWRSRCNSDATRTESEPAILTCHFGALLRRAPFWYLVCFKMEHWCFISLRWIFPLLHSGTCWIFRRSRTRHGLP